MDFIKEFCMDTIRALLNDILNIDFIGDCEQPTD